VSGRGGACAAALIKYGPIRQCIKMVLEAAEVPTSVMGENGTYGFCRYE
jgi:hypothetical protein